MKIQSKGLKGLFVAGLLTVSLGFAGLANVPSAFAAGQTCTWTGAGADNNFSTAENWADCGDSVPTNGDVLLFDNSLLSDGPETLANDLFQPEFGGLIFKSRTDTGNSYGDYVIDLGQITLSGDVDVESGSYPRFEGAITLLDNVTVGGGGGLYQANQEDNQVLTINIDSYKLSVVKSTLSFGVLHGSGELIASGEYTSASVLDDARSFTGDVRAVDGAYMTINSGVYGPEVGFVVDGLLTVCGLNGGSVGNSLTIGGSIVTASFCGGAGAPSGPTKLDPEASVNWTGPITLTSDVEVSGVGEFKISGALLGNFKITQKAGGVGKVTNNSTKNESKTESGSQESKAVERKLSKNSPNEGFSLSVKETGILTGNYASAGVFGVLRGNGSIVGQLSVYDSGTVAPGMSPGCITSGELYLYGAYEVELGGNEACSGYDQLRITGADDSSSANAVRIGDEATLRIFGYGDFVQKKGDTFVIINNQTDSDIDGTFKDLPEGAEVKVGDAVFTISYVGGDGNDVVLTAQNSVQLPGVPNTGIAQIISANPAIVAIAGVVAAAAVVVLRRKAQQ